ncbi:unnamed protein product, partial [Urochloa humidicola]
RRPRVRRLLPRIYPRRPFSRITSSSHAPTHAASSHSSSDPRERGLSSLRPSLDLQSVLVPEDVAASTDDDDEDDDLAVTELLDAAKAIDSTVAASSTSTLRSAISGRRARGRGLR